MPLRLKPRIFPVVVSATVEASEAVTALRAQLPVAGLVVEGDSGPDRDSAVARKMTEPAKPPPGLKGCSITEIINLSIKIDQLGDR